MRSVLAKSIIISIIILPLLLLSPQWSQALVGEDGSLWVQVNPPGFGNKKNVGIVSLCPFQGELYAITRNDATGFELWKTSGIGWTKVTVPGFTDDNTYYGWIKPGVLCPRVYDSRYNLMQNIWGDMIEFNGSLYVVATTGYQGGQLYGSIGFEIWRYDGSTWQAVASSVNSDESGAISSVASCNDSTTFTAELTDSSKSWSTDQWAGCVLRVEGQFDGSQGTVAGTQGLRILDIISNTGDTLTVQQNERAGTDEYTLCSEQRIRLPGDFAKPDYVIPTMGAGDSYAIMCDVDDNGFGEMWNKTIVDFETLNGELYATIGLNYQNGTRVWKTSDGTTWTPASDYSYGLFHGYYPNQYPGNPGGNPVQVLTPCVLTGLESRNGSPVSSSSTHIGKSSVTGTETLFTGGTGTSGCNGRGARVVRLDGTDWNSIVDYFVDLDDDTGTNENGFGVSGVFQTSNFQAWSWTEYDSRLFVSVIRLQDGSRIMYSDTGSTADDAWAYSMGGDSTVPDGFDDVTNIGSHIYAFNSALYAGTITNVGFNTEIATNGADIWKGTGSGDAVSWSRVTGDGFSDKTIAQFEAFNLFGGNLYVAASNLVASAYPADEVTGYSGAKVFKLVNGLPDDRDEDGVSDSLDNCPSAPNGTSLGTCTSGYVDMVCTSNAQCGTGGVCSTNQENADSDAVGDACDACPEDPDPTDTYPPGGNDCGNACECEGNFDGDLDVDGADAAAFKVDFGRTKISNPCTNALPCNGDFTCDQNVSGTDAALFKSDFGRTSLTNPCPNCGIAQWCTY